MQCKPVSTLLKTIFQGFKTAYNLHSAIQRIANRIESTREQRRNPRLSDTRKTVGQFDIVNSVLEDWNYGTRLLL